MRDGDGDIEGEGEGEGDGGGKSKENEKESQSNLHSRNTINISFFLQSTSSHLFTHVQIYF